MLLKKRKTKHRCVCYLVSKPPPAPSIATYLPACLPSFFPSFLPSFLPSCLLTLFLVAHSFFLSCLHLLRHCLTSKWSRVHSLRLSGRNSKWKTRSWDRFALHYISSQPHKHTMPFSPHLISSHHSVILTLNVAVAFSISLPRSATHSKLQLKITDQ